ncbi:Calx-beta domain-containing protein [Sphingomonas sp. SUN039]|uniref:Calx-beta domain-containing protein n=1 Tax=Sphingomonas sp. SUN039 TaxID=2937787 RepID=UPI0021647208|nr:Calx-beta domain-containing protein [Sphingomonas sp. SUN039]UVO55786.1 Ig-like domain-containing protein [Sphingomonas sp. SUN039]
MAAFTPGNIVIYRVGNGSAALSSAATAVFLDEYTPAGVLVQSIALPTADSGPNQTLTAAGSSTSEGMLTRSVDGRYLVLSGYDAAPGTATVSGTTGSAVNRVIGRVAADGAIDTTTALADFSSGNSPRGVVSVDGSSFWVDAAVGGVRYATFGATTSTLVSSTIANLRTIEIFDSQLYVSTGSGTTVRIGAVGTGLPTTGGQTITTLPGLPVSTGSPYQFYLADLTAAVAGVDTLYIADDGAGVGIQKYSLVAGSWVSNGTATTASTVRGLTGSTSGTSVSLFATSAAALFSLTDTAGYNATISIGAATQIATAATNTAFRGVAFAPQNALPTLVISDPTVVEGNSGTTTLVYTVTSSALAGVGGIGFSFATADGSATTGSDYVSQSGTGTIAAGSNSTTISVVVNGDTTVEGNETVLVNLTAPSGATIADAQGVGTITNDDVATPGTLAIDNVTLAEGNAGTTAFTFTVTRTGGSSGTVTVDYATSLGTASATNANAVDLTAASGTLTFLDGETSKTITVQVNGDTAFESDEAFSVVLSNATGGGSITTATGTGTITNDDPAVPGTLAIDNVTLAEGNTGTTAFTFTVTRSGGSDGTVAVDYATTLGTADAGDLTPVSGTLTFLNGETTKTITVLVNGDYVLEGDDSFSIVLANATGGASITTATGNGNITNDDVAAAVVTINDVSVAEGNAGGTNVLTFTVTRSTNDGTFTIDYATANGTATSGDYTSASGTLTFTAGGALTQTVTVPLTGDVVYEGNETVLVNLSNLVSSVGVATIGDAQGIGTITNDDPLPALSIGNATVIEGDAGTVTLVYTITADGVAPAGGIGFSIATADGTATAGTDYVAQSTTGTIAEGATSTTFSVTVNGDTVFERDETVLVNLSSPTNATIAVAQGTGTISNDDAIPASARIFSESFTGFTAGGFAPTPTAGQLDSDIWRPVGFSDNPAPAYGFTGAAATDFGRGLIAANPTGGGIYSVTGNGAIIVQPTGTDFSANGYIEARIQNNSGASATSFDVTFDWATRNNEPRSSALSLLYSTDGVNFTAVAGAAFSTPLTADSTVFTYTPRSVNIGSLLVADGGYLYLRWQHADNGGSGNRDEVGIDNVTVDANLSSVVTANAANISFNEGNSGTTNAVFTITRSNGAGSASVSYATANGTGIAGVDYVATSGTVTFAPGETARTVTVLVNGDTANEANETFFLNLSNPVGVALPSPQSIATIVNDDNGPVAIYDIQGAGHRSSFNGLVVTTSGIVTAVDTNAFYLQDPTGDGNIATSDGILVFTSSAPTVTVGQAITITATVNEFTGSTAGSLSLTQLITPTSIIVNSSGNALPAPVLISTDGAPGSRTPPTSVIENDAFTSFDPATDGIDFWESLEGMRVTIQTPLVVANSNSFGETYVVASGGTGATGVNDRGGITISAGDFNPERIQIDDDSGIFAGYTPGHTQSDRLGDVTGIVNYAFAEYEVIVTQAVSVTTDNTLARETTNLVGDATRFSYASFNLENFDPTDPVSKVALLASEIVNGLRSPDIIGAQEIQDADGAGTGTNLSGTVTAQLLIDAIAALGGPTYRYIEVAPTVANSTGGEPNGNIRNGFFYNTARVTYVEGSAALIDTSAYTGSRRPLVADFMFNGERITAIDLHSTSRGGSDPLWGATQPPTDAGDGARTAQANGVRAYIDAALAIDPARKFVVNGDFNGFYFETALTNLTAGGVIANLYDTLPVQERYSYIFGGNYQTLDHILVSGSLLAGSTLDIVHQNAFLDAAQQATDHDQPVATIGQARTTGTAVAVADGFTTTEAAFYRGTVLANDTGGGAGLVVATVNGIAPGTTQTLASGAKLTLLADGTFTYDPDGAFNALSTGGTGSDSFTYTLPGGSTGTASITITGISAAAPSASDDTITGTPLDDSFDLSTGGNDTVTGGAGNDAFSLGAAFTAADRINGGSGTNDQVGIGGNYTGANRLVLNANTLTNVEVLAALPGTGNSYDIVTHDANVAAGQVLTIFGGNLAAGQNLTFNGSAETDGAFRVYGGLGTDTLTGGGGDDGFYFGPGKFGAGDTVTGGAGTNDQLALDGDYTLTVGTSADVEVLVLLGGPAATPNNFNIALSDLWTGAGATKTVFGTTVVTALTVDGSAETNGNLRYFGGQAADVLIGGAGADAIYGGSGGDAMTGGAGADVFRYDAITDSNGTTNATRDRILDFTTGSDKIDLSRIDAIAGGADDAFSFIGSGAFSNVAGQLRYTDAGGGIFIVEGDVDGDGIADFTLSLASVGLTPPVATDFVL